MTLPSPDRDVKDDVIEKIARALAVTYYKRFLDNDSAFAQLLQEYLDENWEGFVDSARAAVRALAENVSDEMMVAFWKAAPEDVRTLSAKIGMRAALRAIAGPET